jgi:hypothetical protein
MKIIFDRKYPKGLTLITMYLDEMNVKWNTKNENDKITLDFEPNDDQLNKLKIINNKEDLNLMGETCNV